MRRVADATLSTVSKGFPGVQTCHLPVSRIVDNASLAGALPPDLQMRVSKIRTDLDKFSSTEVDLLIHHGYEIAYEQLSKIMQPSWGEKTLPKGQRDGWRDGKRVQSAAKLLDRAKRRSLGFVRASDWVSYALVCYIALVGMLAYLPFALQQAQLEQTQVTLEQRTTELQEATKPRTAGQDFPAASLNVFVSPASSNARGQTTSQPSFKSVMVTFKNETDQTVDLYWVDLTGTEISWGALPPKSSKTVVTYVGHLWIAKSQRGAVIMNYVVSAENAPRGTP
jgi:hypothetical protein